MEARLAHIHFGRDRDEVAMDPIATVVASVVSQEEDRKQQDYMAGSQDYVVEDMVDVNNAAAAVVIVDIAAVGIVEDIIVDYVVEQADIQDSS